MATQRAKAGAGPADIAAQHQEIGKLLDIGRSVGVLRDTHAVTENDIAGVEIDIDGAFQRLHRETGNAQDIGPAGIGDILLQGIDTEGVFGNESPVENSWTAIGEIGLVALED